MSQTDKDLEKQFKNWNPMRDAYQDSNFNKYNSGPGADLEDSHQPAELAKKRLQLRDDRPPFLVFKFVPKTLTLNGLIHLCSTYGNTLGGHKLKNSENMYFIQFASINDMERAFTGLQNNTFGFRVELGKRLDKKEPTQPVANLPSTSSSHSTNQIDYNSKEDYEDPNSNLKHIDPQQHFLIEDDAHEFDRYDLTKQKVVEYGKQNYYTGGTYYVAPKKEIEFMENRRNTVDDMYNANEEKFFKPEPEFRKLKVGGCDSCKKMCDTSCERCSTFYCSIDCQKKEWQKHRFICGKPTSMWPEWAKNMLSKPDKNIVPDEVFAPRPESPFKANHDSTQKAALTAKLPNSGENVILTAISKTNVVFVRSSLSMDNTAFFSTVSIIQKEAKHQRSLQNTPQEGDIVLTKFKENQYNRAMVLNAKDLDNIKMIYVDYGNVDSKSLDELLDAPDVCWHLPRMAVPIILKDVPDFFMTDEVKKYMYTHFNTDLKIVYDKEDKENGINRAELFIIANNESFNKGIASFKASNTDTKKAQPIYREFLEQLVLPVGENVELIVMDNSLLHTGFISCSTETYAQAIQKFQDDIQNYANADTNNSPYTPRVDELCLAKYTEDNLWYRGRCLELVGDGHPTILFFDYGNLSIVSIENIKKYPAEFTFPVMTFDCEIDGLPEEISDELEKTLQPHFEPGTKLICEKVEHFQEENSYTIYLPHLIEKLLPKD